MSESPAGTARHEQCVTAHAISMFRVALLNIRAGYVFDYVFAEPNAGCRGSRLVCEAAVTGRQLGGLDA